MQLRRAGSRKITSSPNTSGRPRKRSKNSDENDRSASKLNNSPGNVRARFSALPSGHVQPQQFVNGEGPVSVADIYWEREQEGPNHLATTCHSDSSSFHKVRRSYSGGTLVINN